MCVCVCVCVYMYVCMCVCVKRERQKNILTFSLMYRKLDHRLKFVARI